MLESRMGLVAVGFTTLAACALLPGCGDNDQPESARLASDTAATRAVEATTSATGGTVVFHMTGLLLVVPPKTGGGDVNVLLPDPKNVGEHVGWLGFGFKTLTSEQMRLCQSDSVYIQAGICYVDLDTWTLDPFGKGGNPAPPADSLPPSVVNVSRLAGPNHKFHLPWLTNGEVRAKVVLSSGGPGDICSLADWTYEDAGQQKTEPLANVLRWEIRDLSNRTLVFRGQDTTIRVPLPATGDVHILLVHVPKADVKDLPPNVPGSVSPNTVSLASHFDAYYDLLRLDGPNPQPIPPRDPRRRRPRNGIPTTSEACGVKVTGKRALEDKPLAIGTIACMVASADPL